jgi:hypothetical protein
MQATRTKRTRKNRTKGSSTQREVGKFAGDAYSLAQRAYKGVNHILKLINIETKFFDLNATVNLDSTGANILVSGIAQGLDVSNRVGDSIRLQGISLNYSVAIATTTLVCSGRFVLIRDLENPGATPAWTDVFETTNPPITPYKYLNRKRFAILHDEAFVVQPLSFGGIIKHVDIPAAGHIKYRGTTSGAASQAEGAIFLLYLGSAATNAPLLNFNVRLLYTDD